MKISIYAIESKRPKWAEEEFNNYGKRLANSTILSWNPIKVKKSTKNFNTSRIISEESNLLLQKVKKNDFVIALDKSGVNLNTSQMVNSYLGWVQSSVNLSIIIGGPNGLSKEILDKSDLVWSLSNLTFPHHLVPIIVAEQFYRVWTIINNHPYHK